MAHGLKLSWALIFMFAWISEGDSSLRTVIRKTGAMSSPAKISLYAHG